MKKIIVLAILFSFFTTSCLTIMAPKKAFVLVDAPKNTTVICNGEILDIKDVTAFQDDMRGHVTLYKYPGVIIKLKKNTELDLKSGDKKGTVKIKTKRAIGMLIIEGIVTFGIAAIVDLASGAYWVPKTRWVDVPAVLNNKTPREKEELKNVVRAAFR